MARGDRSDQKVNLDMGRSLRSWYQVTLQNVRQLKQKRLTCRPNLLSDGKISTMAESLGEGDGTEIVSRERRTERHTEVTLYREDHATLLRGSEREEHLKIRMSNSYCLRLGFL